MARSLRIEFKGAIYHITARGNERGCIFKDAHDRTRFLEKLCENVEAHGIRLYAYVLMGNHFHLLVETPRANLSSFMQQFNTSYTVYFNKRHQRSGHLFEGRYKAKLVEGDRYLLNLTRYIHLNPVRGKTFDDVLFKEKQTKLQAYVWSSYRGYIGLCKKQEFMDYAPLVALVSAGSLQSTEFYQRFVEDGLMGIDEELRDAQARSSKAIGMEGFCRWADLKYGEQVGKTGQQQDVAMRRVEVGADPSYVIECVGRFYDVSKESFLKRRNGHISRGVLMKLLKEGSGLNHRIIAELLGLKDGSGISRKIAELNAVMLENEEICHAYESLLATILNH